MSQNSLQSEFSLLNNNFINTGKIITLTLADSNAYAKNYSWRNNLSRIISDVGGKDYGSQGKGILVSPTDNSGTVGDAVPIINTSSENTLSSYKNNLSEWDVHDTVQLYILNELPSISTSNDYSKEIEATLEGGRTFITELVKLLLPAPLESFADSIVAALISAPEFIANVGGDWPVVQDPWWRKISTYEGPRQNLTFTYTFSFAMGQSGLWNAKEEVFKPLINLIAPTLPTYIGDLFVGAPFPSFKYFMTHFFRNDDSSYIRSQGVLSGEKPVAVESFKKFTYDITFGHFLHFSNVYIRNAHDLRFSNETDQYGYPVAGSVTLDFESITPVGLSYKSGDIVSARFGVGR